MRLLLDEMYSQDLARALTSHGIDAVTARALGLAGSADLDLFNAAIDNDRAILTENVGDFARIAADHVSAGRSHPGVLVALSSRFTRRPTGRRALVSAVRSVASASIRDLVVYLRPSESPE